MAKENPSALIDAKIAALTDWRGKTLARLRSLIREADPDVVEEVKWRKPSNPSGVPTWSHAGIICTGETYKDKVKLTFAKGAAVEDPADLFNASLDGGTRRTIDMFEVMRSRRRRSRRWCERRWRGIGSNEPALRLPQARAVDLSLNSTPRAIARPDAASGRR